MSFQVPILTYHSAQVDGHDYENNDHVALRADLETIYTEGFRVVPLSWIVDWVLGARPDRDVEAAIAITFDDGCSMDFVDMIHPKWGYQRSFRGILQDIQPSLTEEQQATLHASAFVIASPDARRDIAAFLPDLDWISDDWWSRASKCNVLSIENHSWDHNHPAVAAVCQRAAIRGRFDNIDTFEECDAEVAIAADYIEAKTGICPRFFAYPWGQFSTYITDVYFPHFTGRHRCRAAFTAHDGYVTKRSSVWKLPRLVFRASWTDRVGFRDLLRRSQSY